MTTTPKKKKKGVRDRGSAGNIAAIRQWQVDHEKHDDDRHQENIGRFQEGTDKMALLASKKDLEDFSKKILEDVATTKDLEELVKFFVEQDPDTGQMVPKFPTRKEMAPIISLYKGGVITRAFIIGAAGLVGAVVGVGLGLWTLFNWARASLPH